MDSDTNEYFFSLSSAEEDSSQTRLPQMITDAYQSKEESFAKKTRAFFHSGPADDFPFALAERITISTAAGVSGNPIVFNASTKESLVPE